MWIYIFDETNFIDNIGTMMDITRSDFAMASSIISNHNAMGEITDICIFCFEHYTQTFIEIVYLNKMKEY